MAVFTCALNSNMKKRFYVGFRLTFCIGCCIKTPMAAFKESVQVVLCQLLVCQKKKKKNPLFSFPFFCFRKQIACLVLCTHQIQRYNVHPVSTDSSWAPSPQHHSRSGPLGIWSIIVENSLLLFKAVGQLNNTLGQMQSPCWLIEHLQ